MAAAAGVSQAQITGEIISNINHKFTVGNATLPPGKYIFQMMHNTDLQILTVTSADGKIQVDAMVEPSQLPASPQHSEVVFSMYGDHAFLSKVYSSGSKIGVSVVESSREEQMLQKQGQRAVERMEEQP